MFLKGYRVTYRKVSFKCRLNQGLPLICSPVALNSSKSLEIIKFHGQSVMMIAMSMLESLVGSGNQGLASYL